MDKTFGLYSSQPAVLYQPFTPQMRPVWALYVQQSTGTDMNVEFYARRASFVFAININVGFSSVCETQPFYNILLQHFIPNTTISGVKLNFQFYIHCTYFLEEEKN